MFALAFDWLRYIRLLPKFVFVGPIEKKKKTKIAALADLLKKALYSGARYVAPCLSFP